MRLPGPPLEWYLNSLGACQRAVVRMELEHQPAAMGAMGQVARAVFMQLHEAAQTLLSHPLRSQQLRGLEITGFMRTALAPHQPPEIVNLWCGHLENMYASVMREGRVRLKDAMSAQVPGQVPR